MVAQQITLENVRIIYPNFSGRENDYNNDGSREFSVVVDPEIGAELASQGFNVKFPTEDKPNRPVSLQITLSKGPVLQPWIKVVLVNEDNNGTLIDLEDRNQLSILDEIVAGARVNVILNPYNWSVAGRSGIRAYVQKLYIYTYDIDPALAPQLEDFEKGINFL